MYSIHELCAESGYAPRTIHGFVRRGILPRPRGGRRFATYTDEHVRLLREYVRTVKDGRVTRADFAERVAERGGR